MFDADQKSEQPKEFERLKGKKRQLSRFLANELLYDYATGQLDADRSQSMQEFLATSPETQVELDSLHLGLAFCDDMAKTEISDELSYKLSQVRSFTSKLIRSVHWRNWPEATKWTIEALLISVIVAFVAVMGWPKLTRILPEPRPDLTLAEIEKGGATNVPLPPEEVLVSQANPLEALLGSNSQSKAPVESESGQAKANERELEPTPVVAFKDSPQRKNQKPSKEFPSSGAADPERSATGGIEKASIDESSDSRNGAEEKLESVKLKSMKSSSSEPTLRGFVYRAYMELGDLDQQTEQLRADIQALGGKRAGKVRLGWRKPKGSYFHFSLLETNYDTLVEKLKAFGPVRISKHSHWKVMPEGEIRFILWVEDKDLKKDSELSEGEARARVENPTQEEGFDTSTRESADRETQKDKANP